MKNLYHIIMLFGLISASPAEAKVMYIDSEVSTFARADVYAHTIAPPSNDEHSISTSILPISGISSQSLVDKVADGGTAHAYQSASLVATSTSSGLFNLTGDISTSITSPANATAQALINGTSSFYRFYTDAPILLDLDYGISGTKNGIEDPSTAIDLAITFYNNGILYENQLTGAGSLQLLLQSGDYQIFAGISRMLDGTPTFINANGIGNRSNTYNATLDFTITSTTPEPASWLLMIGGIVLIGAIMRCKNDATDTYTKRIAQAGNDKVLRP